MERAEEGIDGMDLDALQDRILCGDNFEEITERFPNGEEMIEDLYWREFDSADGREFVRKLDEYIRTFYWHLVKDPVKEWDMERLKRRMELLHLQIANLASENFARERFKVPEESEQQQEVVEIPFMEMDLSDLSLSSCDSMDLTDLSDLGRDFDRWLFQE